MALPAFYFSYMGRKTTKAPIQSLLFGYYGKLEQIGRKISLNFSRDFFIVLFVFFHVPGHRRISLKEKNGVTKKLAVSNLKVIFRYTQKNKLRTVCLNK